ncbi:MAG TPA: carboxypeptidase-like regulatory domain-containing protein, partial [Candidatus Thermoplasmatota archaeon]|nr:carboxypeptidase-like regulatory domain-containing protein [Candidatus Thermoplasmatota archaeon]
MVARQAVFLTLLLASAMLSGCVKSAGEAAAAETSQTWAAKPTVGELTGSIFGLVVDDESNPISGVTVALLEANVKATTDAGGRFTINELVPQTYQAFFERLGYESFARKVDVVAGNVTDLMVTMKAILVDDAYTLTLPRNFLIKVDHDYINFYLRDANANVSPLYTLRCEPCWYVIHFDLKPKEVLSEASWPPSGIPVVNTQAYNDFYKGWSDANGYGTRVCFAALVNGGAFNWTATCVKDIQKETKLKVFINGGFTSVSFDQRVSTWTT